MASVSALAQHHSTNSIGRVLHALEERQGHPKPRGGDKWQSRCPAHDDHTPSLSIAYNSTSGKALLYCQAGCSLEAILDACALEHRDLFDYDRSDWTREDYRKNGGAPKFSPAVEVPSGSPEALETSPHNGGSSTALVPAPSPAPAPAHYQVSINARDSAVKFDELGALYPMLEDHRKGLIPADFAVPLRLDRLPLNAFTLASLGEQIATTMDLWLTMGETRAIPISCSWAAFLLGRDPVRHGGHASRMLHQLERYHVLRYVRSLSPIRGRRLGTRCFEPYDFTLDEFYNQGMT